MVDHDATGDLSKNIPFARFANAKRSKFLVKRQSRLRVVSTLPSDEGDWLPSGPLVGSAAPSTSDNDGPIYRSDVHRIGEELTQVFGDSRTCVRDDWGTLT